MDGFDQVNLKHIKEPEPVFADISKGDGGRSVMSAIFKGVASALTAPCKCQQQSEAMSNPETKPNHYPDYYR